MWKLHSLYTFDMVQICQALLNTSTHWRWLRQPELKPRHVQLCTHTQTHRETSVSMPWWRANSLYKGLSVSWKVSKAHTHTHTWGHLMPRHTFVECAPNSHAVYVCVCSSLSVSAEKAGVCTHHSSTHTHTHTHNLDAWGILDGDSGLKCVCVCACVCACVSMC